MDIHHTNFRSVFPGNCSSVYRGADPDHWSHSDLHRLVNEYRVRTIIDLRNPREIHRPKSACCDGRSPDEINRLFQSRVHTSVIRAPEDFTPTGGILTRFMLPMITVWFYPCVVRLLHIYQVPVLIFYALMYLFTGSRTYESYAASQGLSKRDLVYLYRNVLESGTCVFRTVFRLLTHPCHYPLMICCQQGKDRTGIVAMLLQDLVGCGEDFMEENYTLTEENCGPAKVTLFNDYGLTGQFTKSDRDTFKRFWGYVKRRYGGAEGYLRHIGISDEELRAIRRNLQADYSCK